MTSWSQERRLELVIHFILSDVKTRFRQVKKEDITLLRREFQGWFSKSWDDLDALWLPYLKEWGNDSCDENCAS